MLSGWSALALGSLQTHSPNTASDPEPPWGVGFETPEVWQLLMCFYSFLFEYSLL